MIVRFEHPWFAPTEVHHRDAIQSTSGKLYKKGVQEIPDELRDKLPSTATILQDIPQVEPEKEMTYQDFDLERKDAEVVEEVVQNAELERKRAQMAKARAAKKTKK